MFRFRSFRFFKSLRPPAPNAADARCIIYGSLGVGAALAGFAACAYSKNNELSIEKIIARNRVEDDYDETSVNSSVRKFQAMMSSFAIAGGIDFLYHVAKAIDQLYSDLRRSMDREMQRFTEPFSDKLLPDMIPTKEGMCMFTLAVDLNETLVFSDWQREIGWRTFKRPGVDMFLEHLAKSYEIVVYSDLKQKHVDTIIKSLDPNHYIRYKLNRAATKYQKGKHYRDLSKLNRDPAKVIYLSAHAQEDCLQPENSVCIKPWKLELDDKELEDLIHFLEYVAAHKPPDVRPLLASYTKGNYIWGPSNTSS